MTGNESFMLNSKVYPVEKQKYADKYSQDIVICKLIKPYGVFSKVREAICI